MANQATLASQPKGMGSTCATAIPEGNYLRSTSNNGFISDKWSRTAITAICWEKDLQGKALLLGIAGC